jgi:Asp/Glu/hydantoin racemase
LIYKAVKGQTSYGEPIGIILMESFMPFPPGCPGNASTFDFPVRYENVSGATMTTLVYEDDPALLEGFIAAGRKLVKEGVKAVTGNCGFMISHQERMAAEFKVPVFMSSLLQLPWIGRMLKPGQKVGIISASKSSLSPERIAIATGGLEVAYECAGMEDRPYFRSAIHLEEGSLDFEKVQAEVVEAARELVNGGPEIGAILFECTDLPPYAHAVQQAVNLPVFDFFTLIHYVYTAVVRRPFTGFV